MARNDGLDGELLDLLPAVIARDHVGVALAVFVDLLEDAREGPLVRARVVVVIALVLLEVVRFLVDRVVRQVHVQVRQVRTDRRRVLGSSEPSQALLVHEDSQGCD